MGQWINWKRVYCTHLSVHRNIYNRRLFIIISCIKEEFHHILYSTALLPHLHYSDSCPFMHRANLFFNHAGLHWRVVETWAQYEWGGCFAFFRFFAIIRKMDTCSVSKSPLLLYQFDISRNPSVQLRLRDRQQENKRYYFFKTKE